MVKMRVNFYFRTPTLSIFGEIAEKLSRTAMEVTQEEYANWQKHFSDMTKEAREIIKRFEESKDGKRFQELIEESIDIMKKVSKKEE